MKSSVIKIEKPELSKAVIVAKEYTMALKAAYRIFKANRPKVKITITK